MGKILLLYSLISLVCPSFSLADESVFDLPITSVKDTVELMGPDNFGPVSLVRLRKDIDSGVKYRGSREYGLMTVAVESDFSTKAYGSVDFTFIGSLEELTVTEDYLVNHFKTIGISPQKYENTVSFTWQSQGFSCQVDFRKEDGLYQYLCHYMEK